MKHLVKSGTNCNVPKMSEHTISEPRGYFLKNEHFPNGPRRPYEALRALSLKNIEEKRRRIWNQLQCVQNVREHPLGTKRVFVEVLSIFQKHWEALGTSFLKNFEKKLAKFGTNFNVSKMLEVVILPPRGCTSKSWAFFKSPNKGLEH